MLAYHAAHYKDEPSGWYIAEVLDFRGTHSQGRTLKSARRMIRDALRLMAECLVERGEPLPRPNPRVRLAKAELQEVIPLRIRCQAGTVS